MTYQPPLIGSKQLLNFTASSWPAMGSALLAAAIALAVVAVLIDRDTAPIATKHESRLTEAA
jgi:copper chaperone NosL